MTTTSTDPRDIEAGLERDRASLASTLDALSDRVSVDHMAKEALGMIKTHASTATGALDTVVRANPLALALIGAGVAWMVLGGRGSSSSSSSSSYRGPSYDALDRWEGSSTGRQTGTGYASAGLSSSGYASSSTGHAGGSTGSTGDDDWQGEVHGLRARASEALRRIESEARSYARAIRDGLADRASDARDFAAERASVLSDFTSDLRGRLSSGLDSLPEGSRETIVAARERAYHAMLRAERVGRSAVADPTRMMEEHPLVAGTVAMALGAAVGAMLPVTDAENRAFGHERDQLLEEASRLLKQERERAGQIAGSLGQELKSAAMDTVETVMDKAGEAASRVTDRAVEEVRTSAPQGSGQGAGQGSGQGAGQGSGTPGRGDPVIG